jgi:hypothetical protein
VQTRVFLDTGRVIGTAAASGDYAVADVSGTAQHPMRLAITVQASPNQGVAGEFRIKCTRGKRSRARRVSVSSETPASLPVALTVSHPATCALSAKIQLYGSGRINVTLLAS